METIYCRKQLIMAVTGVTHFIKGNRHNNRKHIINHNHRHKKNVGIFLNPLYLKINVIQVISECLSNNSVELKYLFISINDLKYMLSCHLLALVLLTKQAVYLGVTFIYPTEDKTTTYI